MAETQDGNGRVNSPRRKYAVVPNVNPSADLLPISDQTVRDYLEGRSAFQKEEPFNPRWGCLVDGRPIFYIEEGGEVIHFGHTPNFRIAPLLTANNTRRAVTPKDLVPQSLRKENPHIDYAEAMFGYVSEQDETREPTAYAGRVSVTSAFVAEDRDNYYDQTIVPHILGSPKPTTFQHYLEQPDGEQTPTHQLRHYGDETQIRGHKLYWRRMIESLAPVKEADGCEMVETSTQHTCITPVRKGVRFQFRVYFENLSDAELGALIWAINLGEDANARHQLGMGKPLGLGVVKLEPKLVLTSRQERYSTLFNEDGTWFTGTSEPKTDRRSAWINTFKQKMGGFDNDERIKELKVLLRMQNPDGSPSIYMQIENSGGGNDYDGRPVLPYASNVEH